MTATLCSLVPCREHVCVQQYKGTAPSGLPSPCLNGLAARHGRLHHPRALIARRTRQPCTSNACACTATARGQHAACTLLTLVDGGLVRREQCRDGAKAHQRPRRSLCPSRPAVTSDLGFACPSRDTPRGPGHAAVGLVTGQGGAYGAGARGIGRAGACLAAVRGSQMLACAGCSRGVQAQVQKAP